MTNETQSPAPATSQPAATTNPEAARKVRLWPLWILWLLTILALVAACYYGWMKIQALEQAQPGDTVSHRDMQQAIQSSRESLEDRVKQLEGNLTRSQEGLSRLEQVLAETTRRLMTDDPTGRTDWLMAEAEYLLRLANQRLHMEKDYSGALVILQAGDAVLAEINESALFPVRKALAREITQLEAVAQVDRVGLFLKLEALISQIESLDQNLFFKDSPLLEQTQQQTDALPAGKAAEGWRARLGKAMEKLEKYFVIRRQDEPVEPLLAPEQIYYLQQNLRLMLEQSELALLDHNQGLYTNSLDKAQRWIEQYFVTNDPTTKAMISSLKSLKTAQIDPQLPDISESLRLLKGMMESVYRKQPAKQEAQDA